MNEFAHKQEQLRALMERHGLDAVLLNRISSFAWATCGGDPHINTADSRGVGSLLVTREGRYLVTNSIEAPRFEQEEKLKEQGWEFVAPPWYAPGVLEELTRGKTLGADDCLPNAVDVSAEISMLRAHLLPVEVERFRALGAMCASAMRAALQAVRPGMTEYEIAAQLAYATQAPGVEPIVNLIATDERISNFRHPIPKDKKLERYAMLVLCGRKWGLVCSVTRLVYFGKLPAELERRANLCAEIDARVIAATRPGKTMGEVFQTAVQAYADAGYPNEWQLHHQGGLAGYEPRELFGAPGVPVPVAVGQAYAWNPSITGVKSEDTIVVGEQGNEVLTTIPDQVTLMVEVDGQAVARPGILEIRE